MTQELRQLKNDFATNAEKKPECILYKKKLKTGLDGELKSMLEEDLAALEKLTEDNIISLLRERMSIGQFHTFIGDVLLVLNPNERQDIYSHDVSLFC